MQAILKRLFACAAAAAMVIAAGANPVQAAPIIFTFTAEDALISYAGGAAAQADLKITLLGDTDNLVLGGGSFGGDLYAGLQPLYSSIVLGFSQVAGVDLLGVEIGTAFAAPFDTAVLLRLGASAMGVFNGPDLPVDLPGWDRVSDFGPVSGPSLSNGNLVTSLTNGNSLIITSLDNGSPFGDATFSAALIPEPASWTVLTLGLMALGLARRRRCG